MPQPQGFSLQVIQFVRAQLEHREVDLSGRYLAAHTSMSSSYARERLIAAKPFNTVDLEQLAELFGFDSPRDFIAAAMNYQEPTT